MDHLSSADCKATYAQVEKPQAQVSSREEKSDEKGAEQ
jgi:hypothetical protein